MSEIILQIPNPEMQLTGIYIQQFFRVMITGIVCIGGIFFGIRIYKNRQRIQTRKTIQRNRRIGKQKSLIQNIKKYEDKDLMYAYIQFLESESGIYNTSFRDIFQKNNRSARDIDHFEKVFYTNVPLDIQLAKTIKKNVQDTYKHLDV